MFVIKYRGNYLDGFYPNDLPVRTKNGLSTKNIFTFSKRNYTFFNTLSEAEEYLKYILRELKDEDNVKRWNDVHWCADGVLVNMFAQFKITEI